MAIFGFLITNAAGESAECGIESGTNAFFVRTTTGGAWGDWVQIGRIPESTDAENVKAADKWSSPIKLTLTGDCTGEVGFDGEMDVTCSIEIPALKDMTSNATTKDLKDRVSYLENEMYRLKDRFGLN